MTREEFLALNERRKALRDKEYSDQGITFEEEKELERVTILVDDYVNSQLFPTMKPSYEEKE